MNVLMVHENTFVESCPSESGSNGYLHYRRDQLDNGGYPQGTRRVFLCNLGYWRDGGCCSNCASTGWTHPLPPCKISEFLLVLSARINQSKIIQIVK